MSAGLRQAMTGVHTWAGLVTGWVLYFVFVTGTAGYFNSEITRWMQPERPPLDRAMAPERAVRVALGTLEEQAAGARQWFIYLPGHRSELDLRMFWEQPAGADPGAPATTTMRLDAASGEPARFRATGGGDLLYRMHWRLRYLPRDAAVWVVGVCSMLMLTAIVAGVIIHRRIFRDFFIFRPGRRQRSWLDAHNLLGVLALPFHIMITWSGLLFFATTYFALFLAAGYGGGVDDRQRFLDDVFDYLEVESAGLSTPLAPLQSMLMTASVKWDDPEQSEVEHIIVHHPGDANARVVIARRDTGPMRFNDRLIFDGTSGALLTVKDHIGGAPVALRETLIGLHEANFAGYPLRWLFFGSGLLGAGMVATGLVLWTVKRRQRREKGRAAPDRGLRLVERLNVATIAGLPVAIAAYFWANRLLPVDWPARADWEAHVMFLTWLALFAHAALRPLARAWREQAVLGAAAFALLPLVNALTTERHLGHSIPGGDWVFAGFDLTMLALGLAFAAAAWAMRRWAPAPAPARADAVAPTAEAGGAR